MKTIWMAYIVAIAIAIAGMWAVYTYASRFYTGDRPRWLYAVPLIVLLPALKMHLSRGLISLRLHSDHLTLESGFLSRTRRTVDMAKIQDVTVSQTLGQRLLNTGDLTLESAGERGAMGIRNLDRPRVIADAILNSSKQGRQLL